jgi:hypothetical protein
VESAAEAPSEDHEGLEAHERSRAGARLTLRRQAAGGTAPKRWTEVRVSSSPRETGDARSPEVAELELSGPELSFHYAVLCYLCDHYGEQSEELLWNGMRFSAPFADVRTHYDVCLNQHGRGAHGFDKESYFADLAATGVGTAEVNGLAGLDSSEAHAAGEVLERFYTFCPALDQFAESFLNADQYPPSVLDANLGNLTENAELATSYGMGCSWLSFEPRSVPESLLSRYPVLRGARVDHPLRSFNPRYNLNVHHPVVQSHYRELAERIAARLPALRYVSIWSNDSGAGFPYTASLYVGRNGGGTVVREWRDGEEIARAAGRNIVNFLKNLRDALRRHRPDCVVFLRPTPFWTELDSVREELDEGLGFEGPSHVGRGWQLEYRHPVYGELSEINESALFCSFRDEEAEAAAALRERGVMSDAWVNPGMTWNHDPLLGSPFPWLLREKLEALRAQGVELLSVEGGVTPSSLAPFDPNREVLRAFLIEPEAELAEVLQRIAEHWVGTELAPLLVEAWSHADDAYRHYPVPVKLYHAWGTWYRLLVRPLVPDIDAIPEAERSYYERHLLAPAHNPNRVDLRYDIGFDLAEPGDMFTAVERFDRELFPRIDAALQRAETLVAREGRGQEGDEGRDGGEGGGRDEGAPGGCAPDLRDRLRALRCWYRNQRNVALWIGLMHGGVSRQAGGGERMQELIDDELANTRQLLALWEESKTPFMLIRRYGETTFMYGRNFGVLLRRKIELTEAYRQSEPALHPDFRWRVPGLDREQERRAQPEKGRKRQ